MNKIFHLSPTETEIIPVPVFYENKNWRMVSSLIWIGLLLFDIITLSALADLTTGNGFFFSLRNLQSIMFSFLNISLLVFMMVIIFSNGGADLSIGAVIPLVGFIIASSLQNGLSPLVAIILGLGTSLIIGLINGILVGIARLPGLLVTLAMMSLLRGFLFLFSEGVAITIDNSFFSNSFGTVLNILSLGLLIVVGIISVLWVQFPIFSKKTGLTSSDSPQPWFSRACRLGIPYLVLSVMAGFVGLRFLGRLKAATVSMGSNFELTVILAVVFGGTYFGSKFGNPIGALLAAFILTVLNNLLLVLNSSFIYYLQGLLLLFALLLVFGYHAVIGIIYRHNQSSKVAPIAAKQEQTTPAKI